MRNKYLLILCALLMMVMVTLFAIIHHKSGGLSVRVIGLIAATCLSPAGMILYTNSRNKR